MKYLLMKEVSMQVSTHNEMSSDKNSMEIYIVIAIALLIIVLGTYFYNSQNSGNSDPLSELVETQPIPAPIIESTVLPIEIIEEPPVIEITELPEKVTEVSPPVPEITDPVVPLPTLDDSDKLTLGTAVELSWVPSFGSLLNKQDIIRNFVVFIDNLSREELVTKFSPLKAPSQKFSVIELDDEIYLNEDSYQRYDIYIDIINSINIEFAITQYKKLQPLFKQAYQELGYPDSSFEQALSQAISVMISAPIIKQPIKLVAPSAMYKFADPELEQLPSVQKLMIRMGPNNMIKLQPKLQQIQLILDELE